MAVAIFSLKLVWIDIQPYDMRQVPVRSQAFLLRNRQLVGRRFCFEGVEAVWLSGEGQIKFFGEEGELLRIVNEDDEQARKAA